MSVLEANLRLRCTILVHKGLAEQKQSGGLFLPRAIAAVSLPALVKGCRANVTAGLPEAELARAWRKPYAARQIDDNDRC